jgi:hypothetical protein
MPVAASKPMQLSVTGTDVARSLVLVIHDSTQEIGTAANGTPPSACRPVG